MQPEDKNDGVQLSTRYEQYLFSKRHLRGTRRPQVFPFIGAGGAITEINEITRHRNQRKRVYGTDGVMCTLSGADGKGGGREPKIAQLNQPTHSNDRVYGTDGVSPTLNTMQGGNRQPFISVDTKNVGEPRFTKHVATLGANDYKEPKKVTDGVIIRRLTPTECERLQGFPDGWTKYGESWREDTEEDNLNGYHQKLGYLMKVTHEISDTQRYKCLGNAVTVNVIADIMERLLSTPLP